MKKFIAIIFTAALAVLGASPTFAATPEDCAESDSVPDGVECPVEGGQYPLVTTTTTTSTTVPGETTTTTTTTTVPGETTTTTGIVDNEGGTVPLPTTTAAAIVPTQGLPKTGSGGSIGLVQIGGLMLAGGLLVVVASRRRTPAPTA